MVRKEVIKTVGKLILCLVLLFPSAQIFAQESTGSVTQVQEQEPELSAEEINQPEEKNVLKTQPEQLATVKVVKQWQQADGSPLVDLNVNELTFSLLADDRPLLEMIVMADAEKTKWSQMVTDLPYLNDQGEAIDYQIQEVGAVDGKIQLAGQTYSVAIERKINQETDGIVIEFIVTNQVLTESSSTSVDEALVEISPVTARGGSYPKDVTFVGQWINESSQLVNTVKSFTAGSDKLGEPRANSGLLRGLAKTFLGWSDKPPVGNGQLAEGARLFSPYDTIETVFADGIMDDAKLYGVYFSLNRPDKPFSNWDFLSMFSAVGSLPIDNNKLMINNNISSENMLPNTELKEVNQAGAIIDIYNKKDDVNSINEVVLEAEFEMDSTVAMLAYKNPVGSNAIKPILSFDYDSRYQNNDFSTADGRIGYTYVDLNVNLDNRLEVPEILYLQFEGFSWRPLYVLGQDKAVLEIIHPSTGQSLGNDVNSFSSLVSNTDPKTTFAVKLNGNKNFTIRVVLRNGDAEKIQESTITPNPNGTVAERILDNMRLKVFSATELRNMMPDKSEQDISALTLKINDSVAAQLADSQGQDTLKISGSINGNVVASAGSVNLPVIGNYALRHEKTIAKVDANTIALGFEQPVITLKWSTVWGDENDKYGYRPQNNEHTIIVKKTVDGVTAEYGRYDQNTTSLEVPEFENGKLVVWSLDELDIPYYAKNIAPATEQNTFVVTNTINPPTTQYTVEKEWEDMNDIEQLRPSSIKVQLYENGVEVGAPVTLLANESYTWNNLIKYKTDGVYTVREIEGSENYTADYGYSESKTIITNKLKPINALITGKITWEDNNDQDGVRPAQITVILKADGQEKERKVVTATDNWSYTFSNYPKYNDQGKLIVYTIEEEAVEHYEVEVNGFDLVNKHTPEVIEISGQKHWDDADNQDGVRPAQITVILKADGQEKERKVVTATDNWSYTFSNLPKYRDQGVEIVYTIDEKPVDKYTKSLEGFNLKNTYTPEVIEISGQKHWEDNDNQDGVRPAQITVILKADGQEKERKIVTATDNWSYTFSNLPKYRDQGVEIVYTIEEEAVEHYEVEVNGFDLVNKHTPEVIEISGQKHWDDSDNQDGVRPAQITVILKADGQEKERKIVTATDNWSYTFSNLPKYRDQGVEIVYTIDEKPVDKYTKSLEGFNLKNTYTPEVIEISGQKHWDDADNQDGVRPAQITVILKADGQEKERKVVTATDNWSYTFSNLPKYRDQGVEIVYTIEEEAVEHYEVEVNGFDLVNKHIPEVIEISGQKHWEDADNQDGVRPAQITVILKADGQEKERKIVTATDNWSYTFSNLPKYRDQGVEIVYTIEEVAVEHYEVEVNGYDLVNIHVPSLVNIEVSKVWLDNNNQDGIRPQSIQVQLVADSVDVTGKVIELNETNDWKATFDNLPEYKAGQKIVYSVREVGVPVGYNVLISKLNEVTFEIKNTYTPEVIEVSGQKTWVDNNNQDNARPTEITVILKADGQEKERKIVTATDNWSYTFSNLLKYRDQGVEIVYTIEEEAVEHYEGRVNGYDLVNIHVPSLVDIEVSKVWLDSNNQDGIRPQSIQVQLVADSVDVTGKVIELNETNDWKATFDNLPEYKAGQKIVYSVREVGVPVGYNVLINQLNAITFEIKNTYTPEVIEISGQKHWEDADNQDGVRPAQITVILKADGQEKERKIVTATDNWSYTFSNLPKYRDQGVEIVYTIEEEAVEHYEVEVNGFDLVNKHTPEVIEISGQKHWEDNDNQDGVRPTEITVILKADGEVVTEKVVKAEDGWKYTFDNLPKYKGGKEIVYTIEEKTVKGYTTIIKAGEYDITNSHKPEVVEIGVEKVWQDEQNQDGSRPQTVIVVLLANGEKVAGKTLELSATVNWKGVFENLPKYKDGQVIKYSVEEANVPKGYTVVITNTGNHFVITNTHTPELPNTGMSHGIDVGLLALGCLLVGALLIRKKKLN